MRDHMDPVFGQALEDRYAELVTATPQASVARTTMNEREFRVQAAWVTVVVGVVVVIAATLAINAGQRTSRPAMFPSSTVTRSSATSAADLMSELPHQPYGRTLQTWTDRDTSTTDGPFRLSGSTAVIAAVCDGGGAIEITDVAGSVHKEGCTRLDVQQPFWRSDPDSDGTAKTVSGDARVTVRVRSGHPRYIVRLWAVDPRILDAAIVSIARTSRSVPSTLRTCSAADIAPTGTVVAATGTRRGIVTITSRSATDCAIRAWPTMQYLASDGDTIGPIWGADNNGKSVDSSEGTLDKYGQFPPARLAAGGTAFLIVDLVTKAVLHKEDATQQNASRPTDGPSMPPLPMCHPRAVATMRLGIGASTIAIPTPTSLQVAACQTGNRVFGVNPVVAERPSISQ